MRIGDNFVIKEVLFNFKFEINGSDKKVEKKGDNVDFG